MARRNLEEYSLKMDYDFDVATLTSITAYNKTTSFLDEDADHYSAPILTAQQALDSKAWSQEVRLSSPNDSRFEWMIGGYYLDKNQTLETDIAADLPNLIGFLTNRALGITPPTTGLDLTASTVPLSSALARDNDKALAGFGQVSYDILPKLELTLALRYDRDKKHQLDVVSGVISDKIFDLWQPKLSLAYHLTDDAMVYLTGARGFRSGGFNATDTFGRTYKSEKTTNLEVGFKTSWLDHRLTLNGAAFYTRYSNRQEYILIYSESAQVLINIPKSRILGVEFELGAQPIERLSIQASAGLLDSQIRDFDGTLYGFDPSVNFKGNQLPFVYGWSYSLVAQYSVPLGDGFDLVPRIQYSARGNMAWHIDNLDKQKSVHLVNAQLSIENENLRLSLWVDNLFNEKYNTEFVAKQWSGGLDDLRYPGQPRTYGVRATYRF